MSCVLTFDLGTTYFKAALFDRQLELVALARLATPADSPEPGWNQIDAERFVAALVELAAQLRASAPQAWPHVEAVSFATQANSFLLLDESDQALTPIILWNDRRAAACVDAARQRIESPDFYQQTGVPRCVDGMSPGKFLWLRDNMSDAVSRAAKVCYISDYLTLLLTGEHVTEAGAAGLTGLLDIHALRWRDDAIASLGADAWRWPRVERAGAAIGTLNGALASRLSLSKEARFVVGCLDQYAGAIGTGNTQPGGVSETTGTVLATVSLADHFDAALHKRGVYQGPAFREGEYYRMLFGDVSANLVEALRAKCAPRLSYEQLDELAAATPAGCDGLRLDLQASITKREPVYDREADDQPLGCRVRAIYEGVAEALREQVTSLAGDQRPSRILAAGGAARSATWRQIKSSALGIPVEAAAGEEPTSRGAAMLAFGKLSG